MKLSELLPPGDLLKQVEGVESGLQQRYRLGAIGLAAALIQLVFLIANNPVAQKLVTGSYTPFIKQRWPLLLLLAGVVLSLLVAGWARFWLEESQAPFRYTYSIADFKPVVGEIEGGKDDKLSFQLSHDLTHRLTERIKRLSLLDDEHVKASAEAQAKLPEARRKSHIHIKGSYLIRQNPQRQWFVEVMPRVRIGPPGSPETLAHKVRFKLADESAAPPAADAKAVAPKPSPRQYEQILERVYFSVATEIYKQIQQDVKRKIELLPNDYYRGVALFHEAEDYARSNTLDAYREASKLYEEAYKAFIPSLRVSYEWLPLRIFQRLYQRLSDLWLGAKRLLAYPFPGLGKVELMCARAEVGYVNMTLYRNNLASIASQRVSPVFEARPVAKRAVGRLERLPKDVRGRDASLFDAYVTLAYAWQALGSNSNTEKCLRMARRMNPARAEDDPKYLYVQGNLLANRNEKLQRYRRAVEIDPRFDIAQFSIAIEIEMDWRERTGLERSTAEIVVREYVEVLKINPGNVSAWSNIGYVRWLLGDAEKAREAFESGREYKEIKLETYVAELDYGLARIAAEEGDFESAYQHFDSGVSSLLSQGGAHSSIGRTQEFYHYDLINPAIMERFERYEQNVSRHRQLWNAGDDRDRTWGEAVETLKDQKTRARNVEPLTTFLRCVAAKLSKPERDKLAAWVKTQSVRAEVKDWLSGGDLARFAGQLAKLEAQRWDEPIGADLLALLSHRDFKAMVAPRAPTRRVKNAVQAFVLDDYGNACYKHFSRSGDGDYRKRSRESYREATRLKDDYVFPHYHLWLWMGQEDRDIEKVIQLAPDWPDGKLALSNHLSWKRKQKERERDEEMDSAKHKVTEADSKREKARQIGNEIRAGEKALKEKREELAKKESRLAKPLDQKPDDAQLPSEPRAGSIPQLEASKFQPGQDSNIDAATDKAPRTGVRSTGEHEAPGSETLRREIESLRVEVKKLEESFGDLSERQKEPPKKELLKKAERLEKEAIGLQKEAKALEEKAESLKDEVRKIEARENTEVNKCLRDLLPHEWLWADGGKAASPKFNPTAFKPKGKIVRELRWEREFSALNAAAFLTWAQNRTTQESESKRLLDHYEERFWPEEVDVLFIRRGLSSGDKLAFSRRVYLALDRRVHAALRRNPGSAVNRKLRAALKRKIGLAPGPKTPALRNRRIRELLGIWLRSDPHIVIDGWLTNAAFNADHRDALCRKLAETGNLSPDNYKLLGERLLRLGNDEVAYKVYRRALETQSPRLLLELGQAFERMGKWDDALQAYQRVAECDQIPSPDNYLLRIGRNLLALGRDHAVGSFEAYSDAIANRLPKANRSKWRTGLVRGSLGYIVSIDGYRIMKDWLDRERVKCVDADDSRAMRDIRSATLALVRRKYLEVNPLLADAAAIGMYPIVTPIVVEAHHRLVESKEQQDKFLKRLVKIRDWIRREIGVLIPGVRLRGSEDDSLANSYVVMINEVPLVLGSVEPERKFRPGHHGDLRGSFNPLTGENDGEWLSEEAAKQAGGARWDYRKYAARHLAATLLADLTPFLGLQETRNLLDEWKKGGGDFESRLRTALVAEAVPDSGRLSRFTQLLQGLIKESVPITSLGVILESFRESASKGEELIGMVEAARLRLKGELPGNRDGFEFMHLAPAFEKEVESNVIDPTGKRLFAIRPEPTQELLAAFRDGVSGKRQSALVIVTRTEGVRPFVRRLIELEFPRVKVLSSLELHPDLHQRVSGIIEYQ